jgi:pre-60S factor REI1
MRSDWHRYNLKRRVASLPPISSETFTEKVLSAQANSSAAAAKASFERNCTTCQKTYFSENVYRDHLGSKKHRMRVLTSAKVAPADIESTPSSSTSEGGAVNIALPIEKRDQEAEAEFEKIVDGMKDTSISDPEAQPSRPSRPQNSASEHKAEHPLSPEMARKTLTSESSSTSQFETSLSSCLFCNYDSPTVKLGVLHMTKIHGLFVPEQNYLTDLEGLLRYLQAKVHENHECLLCHKLKGTSSGVQTHMRDKGHCMIAFETEEEMVEVGQFYDFSSTYSDNASEDTEMGLESDPVKNGGAKLPGAKTEDVEDVEDDGWETDSSFSSLDSADLTSVPVDDHSHQYPKLALHRHHSHHDPRPHRNIDGFHSHAHQNGINAVFHDEFELHLPSGRTAGHRNYKKYYRQNLHSYPSAAEKRERQLRLLEQADEDEDIEVDAEPSRNNGSQALMRRSEAGMVGATESQKKDVRASEIRGRREGEKAMNRYQAKVEKQNNSQKHFRVSIFHTATSLYSSVADLTVYRIPFCNDPTWGTWEAYYVGLVFFPKTR